LAYGYESKGKTSYDNRYESNSSFVKELVKKIKSRGHHIGIHPTYDAYNNFEQLKKEKEELETNLETKITFGREHYLRFEVPITWQIWEDNGMKWDSTCGYADREGFRCGTGDEFSVFNILTKEKLKLKERPLLYMDDNRLIGERIYEDKVLIDNIMNIINTNKKFNSKNVILFHQNIFSFNEINYLDIYETILREYNEK